MNVTVATIVKNEADRWLESALRCWNEFADRVVAVDDASSDDTVTLLRDYGAEVHEHDIGLYGNSGVGFQTLFEHASKDADWVIVLAADMVPASDFRPFVEPGDKALYFNVYDLWAESEYRDDAWWRGHTNWRCWAANVAETPPEGWIWDPKSAHSHHLPENVGAPGRQMPPECGMLHYGYSNAEARKRQSDKYLGRSDILSAAQKWHAQTILMPARTRPLPFDPTYRLTYGRSDYSLGQIQGRSGAVRSTDLQCRAGRVAS